MWAAVASPSLLRVERHDAVAVLTLDEPSRRNALSLPLVAEIVAAMDALEADPGVGALVVTGAPPAFCAGADLGDLAGGAPLTDEQRAASLRGIYDGFLRLADSPLPVVAAVNGAAVGAGFNLALAADVRLASPAARYLARFLDLGLHPGGGHTWLLDRAVGPQTAAALVLFGESLDGPRSVEVGLSWRCVDGEDLVGEAVALAARAASAPRELVARLKATLRAAPAIADHATAVERELVPQVWSAGQAFFAERLAALQAKVSGRPSR
jgi:enoyl-CoA hydratase